MKPNLKHIDNVIEGTRHNLKVSEELLPTFFIGNAQGFHIVGTSFEGDGSKDLAATLVRNMAKKLDASSIVFVSEVWTLPPEYAQDYMDNIDKYNGVKSHPKAVEKVFFQAETHETIHTGMADILPGRELGEITWMQPDKTEGRFSGLLPRCNA